MAFSRREQAFAADIWTAVPVPAGPPKPIVETLEHEIPRGVAFPEAKQRIVHLGYARPRTRRLNAQGISQGKRWAKVIHEAGIKIQ